MQEPARYDEAGPDPGDTWSLEDAESDPAFPCIVECDVKSQFPT
jgi:hypothetical protein